MSESNQLATATVTPGFHKATSALSATLGIEPRMMVETLKKQCFPSMRSEDISDAQLAAFISVANTMDLNPLIPGMLYGYPTKSGGILPLSGPDAILKKLDEGIGSGKLDGYECIVYPEAANEKPTHAVAKIWRKGSERPAAFTATFSEWVVSSNPNWTMRPRHMIWLRALKQCARQVIHGVPLDRDDMEIADMVNVTNSANEASPQPEAEKRAAPPPRAKKGAAAVAENKPVDMHIDVTTTPAKTAEESAKVAAPVTPEPDKPVVQDDRGISQSGIFQSAAQEPAKQQKAFLQDGEKFSGTCKVASVTGFMATVGGVPHASCQGKVTGDFWGDFMHIGGGVQDGADVKPLPVWSVGNVVRVDFLGRKSEKLKRVIARVEKVEAVAQPSSEEVE